MDLGHGNSITFDGTFDTVTRYVLTVEGEPTMHIFCDSADPEKAIHINRVGATGHRMATKGRFEMTVKMTEDADGTPLGVEPRVDSKSVYKYVLPRMILLLGRLVRAATA